jgi:hypothetical protein
MVALVQRSHVEAFAARSRIYQAVTNIEPQVYAVWPRPEPATLIGSQRMNSKERDESLRGVEVDRAELRYHDDVCRALRAATAVALLSDYRVLCEANLAVQQAFDLDIVQASPIRIAKPPTSDQTSSFRTMVCPAHTTVVDRAG